VVEHLGLPADLADGALRLSLGWCTTTAEVDHASAAIAGAVAALGPARAATDSAAR
jgi:cysteine sulfinate desulfinase/cysteine desulfurase-like protein